MTAIAFDGGAFQQGIFNVARGFLNTAARPDPSVDDELDIRIDPRIGLESPERPSDVMASIDTREIGVKIRSRALV